MRINRYWRLPMVGLTMVVFTNCDTNKFLGYDYKAEQVNQAVPISGKITNAFTGAPVRDALVLVENVADSTDQLGEFQLQALLGEDERSGRPVSVAVRSEKYFPLDTTAVIYPQNNVLDQRLIYAAPIVLESSLDSNYHSRAVLFDYQGVDDIVSVQCLGYYLHSIPNSNLPAWIAFDMIRTEILDANTAVYEGELDNEVGLLIFDRLRIRAIDRDNYQEETIFLALCRLVWVIKFELTRDKVNHVDEIVDIPVSSCPFFGQLNFAVDTFEDAV